jgi:hypothetical protein
MLDLYIRLSALRGVRAFTVTEIRVAFCIRRRIAGCAVQRPGINPKTGRRALTPLEMLIVIAIVGVPIALLLQFSPEHTNRRGGWGASGTCRT